MKKILLVFIIILTLTLCITSDAMVWDASDQTQITLAAGERYFEENGNFSYIPPDGWRLVDKSDSEYKVVVCPSSKSYSPNIAFIEDTYIGALEDYVSESLDTFANTVHDFSLLNQYEGETNEGLPYITILSTSNQKDQDLFQAHFFVSVGVKIYVITYSCLSEEDPSLILEVGECVNSFSVED